jgi:hypothetical protein
MNQLQIQTNNQSRTIIINNQHRLLLNNQKNQIHNLVLIQASRHHQQRTLSLFKNLINQQLQPILALIRRNWQRNSRIRIWIRINLQMQLNSKLISHYLLIVSLYRIRTKINSRQLRLTLISLHLEVNSPLQLQALLNNLHLQLKNRIQLKIPVNNLHLRLNSLPPIPTNSLLQHPILIRIPKRILQLKNQHQQTNNLLLPLNPLTTNQLPLQIQTNSLRPQPRNLQINKKITMIIK